jgi:hypothetical protein
MVAVAIVCLVSGGLALAQTGNGTANPVNTGGLFTDVPKDHWAYQDLVYLADRGIITGLPGGQYKGSDPLDRYSAAAMIARAIKYVQNNPSSVTPQDIDVLKDLIFKLSDRVNVIEKQGGTASGSALDARVAQNEKDIAQLRTQVQGLSVNDSAKLADRVNATFILSLTSLLLGIIAVALATLGL